MIQIKEETFTFKFIRKVGNTCDMINANDEMNTQTEIQDKLAKLDDD